MRVAVDEALAPLPEAYHRLYERVVAVCEPDTRIRGLWLSGSLARGTADAGSDLDLLLAVSDADYEGFITDWRSWLDKVTHALLAIEIPRSKLIFTALTDEMCRIDAVIEPVNLLRESPHRTRIVVIDRDGLDDVIPGPETRPGPNADKIISIIREFWRQQAIFPVMVNDRKDLLCAQSGVHNAIQMLYDLFVESNQPLPPMGIKQFSSRLTAEQRGLLESAPAFGADPDSLVVADLWAVDAMWTHGRQVAQRVGGEYPEELAQAVRRYQAEHLPRS